METAIEKKRINFICEVIQRGRIKPQKFRHYIKIPAVLYEELRDNCIIDMEGYYIDESAFLEVDIDVVIVNFISLYMCEDLHRKIDRYIITELTGNYPLTRGGFFI